MRRLKFHEFMMVRFEIPLVSLEQVKIEGLFRRVRGALGARIFVTGELVGFGSSCGGREGAADRGRGVAPICGRG